MSNKDPKDNHNSDDWWYYDYSRMKRSMYESDPTLDPDYEKNASDYQPRTSGGSLYSAEDFIINWFWETLAKFMVFGLVGCAIAAIGYIIYGVYWLICYLF